jgi:hypothetical protein
VASIRLPCRSQRKSTVLCTGSKRTHHPYVQNK